MDLLSGIRVVDVSAYVFGPAAAAVLGHWGADVIKVEPFGGDPWRHSTKPEEQSAIFHHYNRNKRSISIDLSTEDGQEVIYRLVADADVFLTSYLTRTRRKLKIDVDDIRRHNPNIIFVRATGQGPQGPEAERGGYDVASWWARGTLASDAMRVSGAEEPTFMVGHGDGMSGYSLAGGVVAALFHRERTGEAKIVDGSLFGTALWYNAPSIISSMTNGWWPTGLIPRSERPAGGNSYRTRDGRFLQIVMMGDKDSEWVDLCQHLGRPALGSDARFATSEARTANKAEAVKLLDEVFAEHTLEEWKQALATTKAVWHPVQTVEEVQQDPQTVANRFYRNIDTAIGTFAVPVPPVLFDEDGGDPRPAPMYAEHTDEILDEYGFDRAEIERLHAAGAVV